MHQRTEWPQGMQRTDGYWRPSGGYYHPGGTQGRSWTPSGRNHPHAYSKHHFSNRQSEHRSYAIRWRDYSSHRDHNTYKDTSYHNHKDTVHSSPMAPGHRRGRTQGRCGGSRPFPSKRGDKNSSSLLTQGSPVKAGSSSKPSSSSSSSSRSSSSLVVDSSRPDSEHSKDNSFLHRKPQSVTKTKSDVPTKQSHSFYASKSSTHQPSSSSSSTEPVRGNHKSSTVAQSSSASVSSFGKHSESSDIIPIPLSTLDFCNSVPSLKEILRRKPVVVLENLTEKLIKRKLKFAGLHFNGSYAHLVSHKKTRRKILHDTGDTDPVTDADSSTRSLKAGKNFTDVKTTNDKSNSRSDEKVSDISSLLVDPKVMSLSRPLQTAFSNNSSKTNMPFKTSGKGKTPSKMFSPKPLGPIPRHMQMFDLDKLRTKLKGANFGGSRKPRQILNQQSVFYNVNKHSGAIANTDLPQCVYPTDLNNAYGCTTSLADSTKDLKSGDSKHPCSQEVCENEHNIDKLSDDELFKGSTFNVEIKENYEKLNVHEKDKCLQDSESPSSVCDSSNKGVADDASASVLAAIDDDKASQSDGEFSAGEPPEEITYDSVSSPSVTLSPPHLEAIDDDDLRNGSERKAESSPERGEEQESSFKEVTAFFEPEEMDTLCRDDDVETDTERLVKDAIDSLEDKDTVEQSAPSVEESINHEMDSEEACGSSVGDVGGQDLLEGRVKEQQDQNVDDKGDKVGRESSTEKENEEVLDGHSKNDTNDSGNPRTLKDICQDLLDKRTDLLSDISLTINDITSKSSADGNVSNESNLKCLNDPNSRTADGDDPSPVCIITSVQSGAHIYFSEGKSDLNGEALRRKPTHSQEEVLCKDINTERSDNIDLSVNNSPRTDSQNESVLVNNEQSNYSSNAITTVSSSISGMYSPCITAQYSVVVGQVTPPCPTQLENQAINPVLVSSQGNMQEFTSSISQQDSALTTRGESLIVVPQEDTAPLPLGHMTLPNVPSEYPSDNHREQSANETQSIIPNDFENPLTSFIDQDSVQIASPETDTETLSGEKIESQDANIVASICQDIQYSTELTKMVSDLDVMHYEDEEPPVLLKINNDDMYNASKLQENKFDHKDITPLTPEDSNREVDHCPEVNEFHLPQSTDLLTQCKVEYFEIDQEQHQDMWTHEGLIDVASIKTEPDQERIEVGRLNLHRAQGDGSEDSDATLIYSCDEDNTCFEEIFQDSLGHSWPRSAPWTDTEETESPPRYEGKLVIVSDIADDGDADGENTSDTNTSNERLSLIITTLRKDLDEKKSDRRQAKQRPVEEKSKSKDEVAVKSVKKKGKRKAVRSKRKRTSVKVPCLDAFAVAKQPPKKTQFKKRENLIVTLQRKKSSKDVFAAKSSKGMMKKESTKDIDKTRTNLKTKQKRKIKRRLTVRKRRKKVEKPAETSAPLKGDSSLKAGIEPKKLTNIRVKKKKLIGPLQRKRPKKDITVENNEATDVKTEDPLNSDDSDELPTILPPKRRRLQSNGNPLMMMQNSIEKGSSSERIMLEFPRHNWLEQKINQLQQTTSCSPIPDDELASQTSPNQTSPNQASPNQASPKQASPKYTSPKQASPKHASPKQASPKHASLNQASPKQSSPKHASPNPSSPKQASLEEGRDENSSVTIEKEKSDVDPAPKSPDCATDKDETQGASQEPAEELPETRQESSVPDPSKESFSLQEAMQLVGAEDSEGTLVIDEGRFEGEDNVSTDKNGDNKPLVDNDKIQDTGSAEMDNPLTGESDTTPKTGGMGAPLDLCVRKNEKAQGAAGRPKAPPPVQMVLPQVQQPARPVSTDPLLIKETKDVVQNVVVVPQEGSTAANVEASQQALSEALNLSKVVNPSPQCPPASTDFSEMIKGVVMPVVTSESSDAQPSDHISTSPSTETCTGATPGPGALALTQSVLPAQTGLTPVDTPVLPTAHIEPPRLPDSGVMQHGHAAFGLTQAPFPVPSGAGSQVHPHPRQGLMQRNIEGNALDKEFEKHLKEFRQLEMLAARKEREREALLHLKKRKAMLLKEMKIMKTQQSSDSDNQAIRPSLAHNEAQFAAAQGLRHHMDRPNFQNTQHHAQIAELRPFQPGIQTIGGPAPQTKHSMQTSSPMSQTHTSNSYDVSSHRKRPSEDRRPLVQMINLAMLQRGRKLRRLNDDHRGGTGGSSSGSVPTPAHQNKSDTNINPDADVPSSEITHCPYIKRKTPILEPPGSNRSLPTSAALVPAHSQQPFQTAGSLIVPARNGHDQSPAPPPPYPTGTHRMNMVSPSGQSQNYPRPTPTQGQHKNNLTDMHNETISQNPSDPNFNVHHVSQDQPMPYVGNSADRSVVNPNSNPNIFPNPNPSPNLQPPDHFGNVPPQWTLNIQNQFQNNPRGPPQGPHPGMQQMRPPAPPGMNQFVPSSQPYGIRPDRNVDVIDLTTDQDPRKMIHRMPGGETGGTETSVQRELTAALARRQGLDQPMTPRRKPEASTPTNYTTNSYSNPMNSQPVQHRPQSNALYSPQGHAQSGNMMPPTSINPQFQMQQRPGAVSNQYRMQEPTSVKSALLAHGTKMICPPSYPMNTSTAPATSYSSAQYQQQRPMNVSQQMSGSSHSVEGYSPVAEKSPMAPGMTNMQQVPPSYNDHTLVSRTVGQFKPQQNWRPQVPTSVSNVQMSFDKQQQLMMITRKTQWEQFQQQKHAMAQKGLAAGNQMHEMHTAVSSNPQVPGPMYAIAQAAAPVVADSMQQRAAMHQHSIRMMQRTPGTGPGPGPGPAQIQGKLPPPPAYPRDSAMMVPAQNPAPALIEFQQQEGQRRMQPMAVNQPPPRLHQFNGSCVVCGALAMYLCSSCRMVWYCSQPCQNNHWKRHGAECKPVQKPGIPGQM